MTTLTKIGVRQPHSIQIDIPRRLRGAFCISGAVPHDEADVGTMMMAGAMTHRDQLFESDEDYLENVGLSLIDRQIGVSQDLKLKLSNIAMGSDLFRLDPAEKYDWAIFCNWHVTGHDLGKLKSDATCESNLTFERGRWTTTFRNAGLRGFTIVNFNDGPKSFDRLKKLALENNEGITMMGDEYSFQSCGKRFRAQNYHFERLAL